MYLRVHHICWGNSIIALCQLTHCSRDKISAIFQMTFSNAYSTINICDILTEIPLKFVPKGPINNISALVQIIVRPQPGDKPLSEPMIIRLPMHTYVTRSQWWCQPMETFSTLLAISVGNSPVTGEFHAQSPVTRSFDVFFDLHLNKRLSKQSWVCWLEMPSCSLWRHCNEWVV